MIGIVDFGSGNPVSIYNMLRKAEVNAFISADATMLEKADKLILPGVCTFDHAMKQLNATGITKLLVNMVVNKQTPLLGICLGMQLLGISSEEGERAGLGFMDAVTKKMSFVENVIN